MSSRGNYSRYFIIIQEDEKGYSLGEGKQATGYAKLEKRNSKVKISFFIQNLKKTEEPYYAILICSDKKKKLLKLNKISLDDRGRGEVKFEYEDNDIAYAHVAMQDVKGAAVVKMTEQNIISVLCGAVGENLSIDWKTYFVEDVKERKEKAEESRKVKKNIAEEIKDSRIEEKNRQIKFEEDRYDKNDKCDKDIKDDKYKDNKDKNDKNKVNNNKIDKDEDYSIFEKYEKDIEKNKADKNKTNKNDDQEKMRNDDFYKGSTAKFLQKICSGYEEYDDLAIGIGNTKLYKIYFEEMSCADKNKDYNKYSIIYYPMMTYYQYIKNYSYFLYGFKKDKRNKIKYMVYGIPGKNTMNDQPFGGTTGFVTWVAKKKCEDNKGNMGYWLMFYDFENSCVVIPVK